MLADFGDFVLDHEDLDAILTQGCRLVAEALDADLAKVIQIEKGSGTGLVRAGFGWRPGVVGIERISLRGRSSEAFAIRACEPVITNNVAKEKRFHFPKFLRDEGVVALINVPIFLPKREPWGVLQVDARTARTFGQDDVEFLKTYAMVLGPVIDRLLIVAEREEREKHRGERDARLRGALEEMEEGFCVLAKDFTILEHNHQALRLRGKLPESVIGRSVWKAYPDLSRSALGDALQGAMANGTRLAVEHQFTTNDGERRWLNLRGYPAGEGGLALVWRDITEAREAQIQLTRSEEWLRSAVEVGQIGLWHWDVVKGEVDWSEEHYRLQGYAVDEVAPSYQAWLDRVHPDERDAQNAAIRSSMETGDDYVGEFRVCLPDGGVHWLRARGRFFFDADGQPSRMIGAAIDVTDARVMQERQTVLVAELQHRTRNLIGVIRSIANRTARNSEDLSDFQLKFEARLGAMARVQGLLSRLGKDGRVTFDELLEAELSAISGEDHRADIALEGPRGVRLRSSTVQTLAMALHELATNALKYGALRQADASLTITWRYEGRGEGDQPWLHVDWRERGVAMPRAPVGGSRIGSGRTLIQQALPYQLGARTTYSLTPDGVHCTISIPVSQTAQPIGQHLE